MVTAMVPPVHSLVLIRSYDRLPHFFHHSNFLVPPPLWIDRDRGVQHHLHRPGTDGKGALGHDPERPVDRDRDDLNARSHREVESSAFERLQAAIPCPRPLGIQKHGVAVAYPAGSLVHTPNGFSSFSAVDGD